MHFLAALLDGHLQTGIDREHLGHAPLVYRSARDAAYEGSGINRVPIYLARAEGNAFRVLTRF